MTEQPLLFSGKLAKAAWCNCCQRTTACVAESKAPFPDSIWPGQWRFWWCFECGVPLSSSRPFTPWMTRIALVAGGLLTLISLAGLWLWFDGKAKPGASPAVIFGFAAFSMAVTLFFVRQLRRWPAYAAGVASVTPLKGDACPICDSSLVGASTPACHYCGVTVITD